MVQVEEHLRETRAISETGGEGHLGPIATCRELSPSAYLCFPHIELMFLFYAFEGAVASHIEVVTEAGCPGMVFIAATALVSYPIYAVLSPWRREKIRWPRFVSGRYRPPVIPVCACHPHCDSKPEKLL